jgi:uncharacterized membrane protein
MLWTATILIAIVAFFLLRNRPRRQVYLVIGLLIAGLATAWLILRPLQTLLIDDAAQVQAQIGQGTPVLLEFQSPY